MTAEEKQIIDGCRKGNTSCQRQLYDMYGPDIKAVCMRYTGDEQEGMDLFHDIFVFILTHFGDYDSIQSLGGWLHRIAVNKCIDYYRRQSRYQMMPISDREENLSAKISTGREILTERQILAFVNQLPPKQRMAFNLYEVDGISEAEIVQMMDETPTNVRTLISRAKSKLRDLIRGYLKNEEYEL